MICWPIRMCSGPTWAVRSEIRKFSVFSVQFSAGSLSLLRLLDPLVGYVAGNVVNENEGLRRSGGRNTLRKLLEVAMSAGDGTIY